MIARNLCVKFCLGAADRVISRARWYTTQKEMMMMMKTTVSILALIAVMLAGLPAFASTEAVNTNTISPALVVSVTVQKAVRLTLATGTGCTVTAAADYSISFGAVDALGINNGCGSKFAPATPGTTNAVYYTDYRLTPLFTSQTVSTNTLTAYVSSTFAKANLSIVKADTAPAAVTDLTAMSTASGAQTTVATNATNGTAITRYVGVAVAPTNGAGLTGADSATITYTLTVN
jgi:hypothetical protein